ncbi:MAG: DUF5667 domain-containing protein, partial [Candidatus Promineifilaceae bacterium]
MFPLEESERLDRALERQRKSGAVGDKSLDMPGDATPLSLLLATAAVIEQLPALPEPDAEALAVDRAAFMAQVDTLPAAVDSGSARTGLFAFLTRRPFGSHLGQRQKEPRPMIGLLVKAALIVTILFSSLGGTAVLSASTLPGSPIYPVKLMLEEARLSMTGDPANQANLHLAFAQDRAEEMAALAALGRTPNEAMAANFQAHWRGALAAAAELPDEELAPLMTRVQAQIQEQEQLLQQAQAGAAARVRQRLTVMAGLLAEIEAAAELAQGDPDAFRVRIRQVPEDWPGNGPGFGPGECQGDCPEGGYAPGPGYGPGQNEGEAAGPGYGPGPGEGDQSGEGIGPSGPYGPGDGECPGNDECDGDGPNGPNGPGEGAGPGEGQGPGEGVGPGEGQGPGEGIGPGEGQGPGEGVGPGEGQGPGEGVGPGEG